MYLQFGQCVSVTRLDVLEALCYECSGTCAVTAKCMMYIVCVGGGTLEACKVCAWSVICIIISK